MKFRGKKILKYTLLSLLGLFLLVVVALTGIYFYLNSAGGQRWMAEKAVSALEKEAGVKARIGKIEWGFPARVKAYDILIWDHKDKEMLKVDKLSAQLAYYNFITKKITIAGVGLENVQFNLTRYKGEPRTNLGYVLKRLEGDDTSSSGRTDIVVKSIDLKNVNFVYDYQVKPVYTDGIDFNHVDVKNLNGRLTYLILSGPDVAFKVKSLSFREKSGFVLEDLRTRMSYTRHEMEFNSLYLKTPHSEVRNYLKFTYGTPAAFDDFEDSVSMDANLVNTTASMRDIAFFTNGLQNKTDQVKIVSADVLGTVAKLRVKGLQASFGQYSHVSGDVSIRGLPRIKETFIDTRIRDLLSSREETMRLLPETDLPIELEKFGKIAAKGNFTGFVNDFVSYSTIRTDIGNVVTDLNLKLADNPAYSTYTGKVKTENLDIGKVLEEPFLGMLSANVQINGKGFTKESIRAQLAGSIQHIDLRGYPYQNLTVNGDVQNQFFNGKLTARDPNLNLDFAGTVDFKHEQPLFNFKADIREANLRNLHITDDTITLATQVDINIRGLDIDSIEGTMKAHSTKLITSHQEYSFDTISLVSVIDTGYRELGLYSELMQATIVGEYKISQLPDILKTTANRYIDSSFMRLNGQVVRDQYFDFDVQFHDMEPLMQMLHADFVLQDSGYIKGRITSTQGEVTLDGQIPGLGFQDFLIRDIGIKGQGAGKDLDLNVTFSSLNRVDSVLLQDFKLHTVANNDRVRFDLYTSDVKKEKEAKLQGSLDVVGSRGVLQFDSSQLVLMGKTWQLTAQPISFYSDTLIDVKVLSLVNGKQQLRLTGEYSPKSSRTMRLLMDNLDLATVTAFVPQLGEVKGDVNGQVLVTDLHKNPIIEAGIYVAPFVYDMDTLGTLRASTNFDQNTRLLTIDATVQDQGLKEVLNADGTVAFSGTQAMDVDVIMNQTDLRILEPAVNSLVSDLDGKATADMHIGGTVSAPKITGKIDVENAALTVNYLQTRYRFSHNLILDGNTIDIKNLDLRDVNNHRATMNGTVDVRRLDRIVLRLAIDVNNFQVLNTAQKDNEAFYGQVYGTGYVSITGATNNLQMYVKMRSDRNSEFYMPIGQAGNFYGYDYITFIDKTKYLKDRKKVSLNRLRLSMDLEINEGLLSQIIFDPRVGDLIQARGNANLRLDINTEGDFAMYGVYTISRGSYRFTAYDVIKKDFVIQDGSSISWTGSPYDAQMNVNAFYLVRANLSQLATSSDLQDPTLSAELRRYRPVEARMKLTGALLQPEIALDFEVQELSTVGGGGVGGIETLIRKVKNDDQELNKQVVSLLVFNNFTPVQQGAAADEFGNNTTINPGTVGSGLTDIVSNQLNRLLSNAGYGNVQVGVDYRPSRQTNQNQVENELTLNASTDLFTEKVNVAGAYDVTNNTYNAQVSYKLKEDGNLRGKVFSRSDTNPEFQDNNSNTIGVGLFFRKEFDTFSELFHRKKREKKK